MTLERLTYGEPFVVKVRLIICPCGYEFDDGEEPSRHFLEDHTPEDFGLTAGRTVATDGGER